MVGNHNKPFLYIILFLPANLSGPDASDSRENSTCQPVSFHTMDLQGLYKFIAWKLLIHIVFFTMKLCIL